MLCLWRSHKRLPGTPPLSTVSEYKQAVNVCKANENTYVIDSGSNVPFSNCDLPFSSEWESKVDRENTVADIIAVFEKFLSDRGISVPHDYDEDGNGVIFGYNYAELSGNLEDKLIEVGLLTKGGVQ